MKMQKLVKICKNERALLLYDTADGVQWLGNRTAMFPLYSHPKYAEENIFAALDINEKQREKITFKHYPATPSHLDVSDFVDSESVVERAGGISIYYCGKYLIPYKTQQGIMFVNGDSLAPLADQEDKMLYERQTASGETYFAVKSGFMVNGIVTPENIVDEVLLRQLKALYQECELTLYNQTPQNTDPQDEQQTIDALKEMYGADSDEDAEDDE